MRENTFRFVPLAAAVACATIGWRGSGASASARLDPPVPVMYRAFGVEQSVKDLRRIHETTGLRRFFICAPCFNDVMYGLVVDPSVVGHDRAVLYVDGAKMAVVADADGDRDQAFVNGIVTVGEGFFGEIDDLRITARALAPSAFLQERTPAKGAVILFR